MRITNTVYLEENDLRKIVAERFNVGISNVDIRYIEHIVRGKEMKVTVEDVACKDLISIVKAGGVDE